jgi:hypothetical protein
MLSNSSLMPDALLQLQQLRPSLLFPPAPSWAALVDAMAAVATATTPTSENIDTYAEAVSLTVGLIHGPRDRNRELGELL